jgi:hypothetical protein
MTYTSNTHVSGEAITAAHANNWETQYTQVRRDFMEKFSTASTGTRVFSLSYPSTGQTFTGAAEYVLGHLYMPTHWQKSNFELVFMAQRTLSTGSAAGDVSLSFKDYDSTNITWGTVNASHTAFPSWTTANGTVTLFPGRLYSVNLYVAGATDYTVKNFYLSGTSTDATITPASPGLLFTTRVSPIGTYLSTAAT